MTDNVTAPPSVPLTSSQLALLRPDGTTPRNYDNVVAARFSRYARISPPVFQHALVQAVGAQAGYRLRFGEMIARFSDPSLSPHVDFVFADSPDDVVAPLDGVAFDLAYGPLVRCCVGIDDDLVRAFAVAVPHIVMDGTTQELLLRTVARALTGRDVEVCDEPQYRRYVSAALCSEDRALAENGPRSDDLAREWEADRVHLGRAIGLVAPDYRRPERAVCQLHPELADMVMASARIRDASVLDLVLAAYGCWATRCIGVDRHLVRLIVGVRERTLPPFAGCLINTVPLVVHGIDGGADPVADVIERKRLALVRRFLPYVDVCQRLLRHDEGAVDLLEGSTMVTYRRIRPTPGTDARLLVDVDHTLPPAWPRAPVLLRILSDEHGVTLDVETDHRLPAAMHAGRIAAGLVDRLESLSTATNRSAR